MAIEILKKKAVTLIDGTEILLAPLKLVYLKEMMDAFDNIKKSSNEDETLYVLLDCARICMKQFLPELDTVEKVEDNIDLKTLYAILDIAANISLDPESNKSIEAQAAENLSTPKKAQEGESWNNFDLAEYETQAFLLGIWKNIDELESSISLPELTKILSVANEKSYNDRKFFAAIQGVDLDAESGNKEEDPWEAMKSRVAQKSSGIPVANSNDITSFQGVKAKQAGFGIGMGLDYEKL